VSSGWSSGVRTSGQNPRTTNRGTQTNKCRVGPRLPLQIAPQTLAVIAQGLPLCNPTCSPLHDLRDPQRKPEGSRDEDGREKGGNENGPEEDGKGYTGHHRVLLNDNPPRCHGEQPRGSIEGFDQSWLLDQSFLLVREN